MTELKIKIIALIEDGTYPDLVRCSFHDALGNEWFITEKLPVISRQNIDHNSILPIEASLSCTIIQRNDDDNDLVTINTDKPWGICAEGGETIFEVNENQLFNI